MGRIVKSCIQCSLKLTNLTTGIVGFVTILYSLWMVRAWQRDVEENPADFDPIPTFPWFIHAFLVIGISLCAVTFLGQIAAATANVYCLSFYMGIMFLVLLLEIVTIADVVLNADWQKDLPNDPSGRLDDFKHFVESNRHICQWVALGILSAQGCSILLATVLRTLKHHKMSDDYDSDGDYAQTRLPLLNHLAQPEPVPYHVIGEPYFTSKNDIETQTTLVW